MVSNMDAALSLDQIQWLVAFIKTVTCSPIVYTSILQVYEVRPRCVRGASDADHMLSHTYHTLSRTHHADHTLSHTCHTFPNTVTSCCRVSICYCHRHLLQPCVRHTCTELSTVLSTRRPLLLLLTDIRL